MIVNKENFPNNNILVKTNIGAVPVWEYADMKATEYGFCDYKELYSQGFRIGVIDSDLIRK